MDMNSPYPHVFEGRLINTRKHDGFLLKTTIDPSTGINLTEADVPRLDAALGLSGELISGVLLDGVFLEMTGEVEPNVFWWRITANEDHEDFDLQHFSELVFAEYDLSSDNDRFPVETVVSGSTLIGSR